MCILDTNVISAVCRPDRAPQVAAWLRGKCDDRQLRPIPLMIAPYFVGRNISAGGQIAHSTRQLSPIESCDERPKKLPRRAADAVRLMRVGGRDRNGDKDPNRRGNR